MKALVVGALAWTSIGAAHAQDGSISFAGFGTGSGYASELDYLTWETNTVSIDNGTASASFQILFHDDLGMEAWGSEGIASLDGMTGIGNYAYANTFPWADISTASFSGSRSSGAGHIFMWEPGSNGSFSEYFSYSLQTNGRYTVTGGGSYWYQTGNGERTYGSAWEFHDVTISFVNAPIVPEPTSWALLILGFGAVGGATRYRRSAPRATFTAA